MPMKNAKMILHMIDIVVDEDISFEAPEHIETAIQAACSCAGFETKQVELCLRFAADETVQQLNQQWRGKDKVTDVLSFPMQEAPCNTAESLGDIALAVPFITHEATRLNLPASDHCLHLIIHATLHLLGYDHIDDEDAMQMQSLEKQAMQRMKLHDPYPEVDDTKSVIATNNTAEREKP